MTRPCMLVRVCVCVCARARGEASMNPTPGSSGPGRVSLPREKPTYHEPCFVHTNISTRGLRIRMANFVLFDLCVDMKSPTYTSSQSEF